jgi:nucleoside-diphosphate-sugar epimerase
MVLVTGATGFIGAHIVDKLLLRGLTVRGATRSLAKGEAMIMARPQYDSKLSFVQIKDFESPGGMKEAVQGVDAIIHTASVRRSPKHGLHSVLTFILAIYIQHHEQREGTSEASDQRCTSCPGSGK